MKKRDLSNAIVKIQSYVLCSSHCSGSLKCKISRIYAEHFSRNTVRTLGTWHGWKDISHLSPEEQEEELEFREKKELGWLGI